MLRKDAKIELLGNVPLFERCSKRELGLIAALADLVDVPAGETLTTEGKPGQQFIVLVEGQAEVRRKGRRVAVLGAGDFLGEIALITDRPRTATVTTTIPAQVLAVSARDFRTLMRDVPSIQTKMLQTVAERLPQD